MATSTITIEELTGTKRRLLLIGGALPHKGAPFGGETVVATNWNPGNPEGTQQVLSPQEDPSEWEGSWRTTQLVGSPAEWTDENGSTRVTRASTLADIMESLRVDGQVMRMTWYNQQGSNQAGFLEWKKVRLGRLTRFIAKPDTLHDIMWSATWDWFSRGEAPRQLATTQDDLLASIRASIVAANQASATIELDKLRAANKRDPVATQFTLGNLESLIDAPLAIVDSFARFADASVSELQKLGELVNKTRDVPASLLNRAVASATNAVAVANQFLDEMSRKGPETLAFKNRVSILASAASYYGRAQTQAQLMATLNSDLARQARLRRSGLGPGAVFGSANQAQGSDILEVYVPKQGDTFMSIASRFYQNADLGTELAKANGIKGYAVSPPARTPLIIPTRAVLDKRARAGL